MDKFLGARRLSALTCLAVISLTPAVTEAAERTLYSFAAYPSGGDPQTGVNPSGTLLRDATGALYGANYLGGAYYNGSIFKLTPLPPGGTRWSVSVLHTFAAGSDGGGPNGDLVMDASGAIYGTAQTWGWNNCGSVFKLTPPQAGMTAWTKTTLYNFNYIWSLPSGDGCNPGTGVIRDASGALYGTTYLGGATYPKPCCGFGTVFKLAPPAPGTTGWKKNHPLPLCRRGRWRNPHGAVDARRHRCFLRHHRVWRGGNLPRSLVERRWLRHGV